MHRLLTPAFFAALALHGCSDAGDTCTLLGCFGEVTIVFAAPPSPSTQGPLTVLIAFDGLSYEAKLESGQCSLVAGELVSCQATQDGDFSVVLNLEFSNGDEEHAVSLVVIDSTGALVEQSAATIELTTPVEPNGPGCGVCWTGGTFYLGP